MKRKEQRSATHARVLAAANACFENRDVREVSMQDIAVRAETSVGALYVHFRNRDALIAAIVVEKSHALMGALRAALLATQDASVPKALEHVAAAYVATVGTMRPYLSVYADHMARSMSVDLLRNGSGLSPLVQMVGATFGSLTAGVTFEVEAAILATSILSLWRGVALAHVQRHTPHDAAMSEALARMTVALLASGCPKLLELDARLLTRAMAQYLKDPAAHSP